MSFSLGLDLASYFYGKLNATKQSTEQEIKSLSASVIIPAHNEEQNIERAVRAQYEQTKKPKSVVVIDHTDFLCRMMEDDKEKYPNFIYVNNEVNKGKAESISSVVRDHYSDLGDVIYINDGDTIPDKNCLEELVNGFDASNVAAVTGLPTMVGGGSLLSRILTGGKQWQIDVFSWRKGGQAVRSSMYVLCGAIMAIRKDVLRQYPIPTRTKTEDLDYTWVLQEKGFKLNYNPKATCKSHDVTGFMNHWKQTQRWHDGAWQALYRHGKDLHQSKGLLYTTLIPMLAEVTTYLGKFVLAPVLFSYDPSLVACLIAADLAVSTGFTVFKPKSIKNVLGAILYAGGMCPLSYTVSGIRTTIQKFNHQEDKWANKWGKNMKENTNV
jgi:cellulose synthase/poly-beta-1,6-N-acetylglucosamine synthase-like glycosyltransferase